MLSGNTVLCGDNVVYVSPAVRKPVENGLCAAELGGHGDRTYVSRVSSVGIGRLSRGPRDSRRVQLGSDVTVKGEEMDKAEDEVLVTIRMCDDLSKYKLCQE